MRVMAVRFPPPSFLGRDLCDRVRKDVAHQREIVRAIPIFMNPVPPKRGPQHDDLPTMASLCNRYKPALICRIECENLCPGGVGDGDERWSKKIESPHISSEWIGDD